MAKSKSKSKSKSSKTSKMRGTAVVARRGSRANAPTARFARKGGDVVK